MSEKDNVYSFPTKNITDGSSEDSTVVEGEVVESSEERAAPVDPPEPQQGPTLHERAQHDRRRPIVPGWFRSRQEFAETAKWAVTYYSHSAGYHAFRSPVYATRLVLRAPRGFGKVVVKTFRWVTDAEGHPIRLAVVRQEDPKEYLRLSAQRDGRIRGRTALFVLGLAAGAPVVVLTWEQMSVIGHVVLVALVVGGLGALGTQADRPLASRAVVTGVAPKLTSDIVIQALSGLGIPSINQALDKGRGTLTFPAPITRDGPGYRAEVDLPHGVTAGDVIERRSRLASGLRRPLGCVWPESAHDEHEGRLVVWVGDQDMRKTKQPTWSLGKGPKVDLFRSQPFGTDQRGRWVQITLTYISVIIGAVPRMGKTVTLRELLLIAALDPRAELHTYDFKGTGDLDPLEPVTHRHGVGGEDEIVKAAVEDLRSIQEELRRRAKVIRGLSRDICPDNKVTTELSSKKSLGLHPIVVGIDECQVPFEHPTYGGECEEICTDIVKRGPALGITLMLATQRPDAKSLPTGISANATTRFCLKVQGQTENDMVLGTSKYRQGVRATTFAWEDKGIGYLVGEGADAQIVQSVYQDGPSSDRIVAKARALREKAGTLSGHAIGQDAGDSEERDTLPEDALSVTAESEPKVWNETVAARLAEFRPEVYGGWGADQLTAAFKPHELKTNRQVWGTDEGGTQRNRRGFHRADLQEIVTERSRQRGTG